MLGRQQGWWGGGVTWLWIASAQNWKGATSLKCEGQTRLISLQQPLKFLPWDINEVIHRKAAARHTTRHHAPLPTATSIPLAPLLRRDSPWEGQCCAKEEAHTAPPTRPHTPWSVTASDRWPPEQEVDEQMGGVCSCACVAMPGEGDNSLALCPTSTEK